MSRKAELEEQLRKAEARIRELEKQGKWMADSLESFRQAAGGFPSNCQALDAIRTMTGALNAYSTLESAFWTRTRKYRQVMGHCAKALHHLACNGATVVKMADDMVVELDDQLNVHEGKDKCLSLQKTSSSASRADLARPS